MKKMYFYSTLISLTLFSLLLNLLTFNYNKPAIEIVNEMGIGYNLGNGFDCYNNLKKIEIPDDQITLCGNPIPTKDLIIKIKKYGFKTIRFPVTWINFIDSFGNINSDWLSRVKEVIDWIIDSNMYCILNMHNDNEPGNWLSKGMNAKDKFIIVWTQIAKEFIYYDDEHLIFESMNEKTFYELENNNDFTIIEALNQAFVDTIRNTGGNNAKRLLLISGSNSITDYSYFLQYKLPVDPINKIGISFHYYYPVQFTLIPDDNPWTYKEGRVIESFTKWGDISHYNDLINNFEFFKEILIDKGIPVILVEVGVLTEQKKEIESIRDYLYTVFSFASCYEGVMACLWDTSNKNIGDMNFYNRQNNQWYDDIIKNNFKKISKGKFPKPKDYYYFTNSITVNNDKNDSYIMINVEQKHTIKVIFNVNVTITDPTINNFYSLPKAAFVLINIDDSNNKYSSEEIKNKLGKREYDGSYTFTIDTKDKNFSGLVRVLSKGLPFGIFNINYLTLEFEESLISFNYASFKTDISKY